MNTNLLPKLQAGSVALAVVPVPPSGENTAADCWAVRNLMCVWHHLKHSFRTFF